MLNFARFCEYYFNKSKSVLKIYIGSFKYSSHP